MEILNQLNSKIEALIHKKESLELENLSLSEELENERETKRQILARVEELLSKIQDVSLD